MQFSWKRREKSGHSTTGCRWWTTEGLQIYWTVPSTVAEYLIDPLNKADVIISILQMRKLRLERLSNKPKSTHLVCGPVGIRTQISSAFPESSLSHVPFPLPIPTAPPSPRRPGGFSVYHLFGFNTTTLVTIPEFRNNVNPNKYLWKSPACTVFCIH